MPRASRRPPTPRTPSARTAIWLALLAAIGFGSFFAGIDRAEETADVAWVLITLTGVVALAGG